MDENAGSVGQAKDKDSASPGESKKIDWSDPTVPVGNGPKMPAWTLALSVIVWVGWVVFLLVMVMTRSGVPAV
jgi:hypothetical protein